MSRIEERGPEAVREMAATVVSRRTAWALVALFLLPLVAVPGWRLAAWAAGDDGGAALGSGEPAIGMPAVGAPAIGTPRAAPPVAVDAGAALPARLLAANRRALATIDGLEGALEEGSPLRAAALPWSQLALTAGLGAGNQQVAIGDGGRLYFRPGLDLITGRDFLAPSFLEARRDGAKSWQRPPQPDPRPALVDLAEQLAAEGIELLFLPVPTKAAIEPQQLAGQFPGWLAGGAIDRRALPLANGSTAGLLAELERAGIATFDPAPLLVELSAELAGRGGAAYLETDSHWSPAAVERVAAELARRLSETAENPLPAGAAQSPAQSPAQSTTVTNRGDLARLLNLPAAFPVFAEETVALSRPAGASASVPAGAERQGTERDGRVLLLGDSFTNVYSQAALGWGEGAGLGVQLAARLDRTVEVIAVNGDGAWASRAELVRRRARAESAADDPLAGVTTVVLQVAARELAIGDWRVLALPPKPTADGARPDGARPDGARPDGSTGEQPERGGTVTGTIAALAPLPDLSATPYREALRAIHLVGGGAPSGKPEALPDGGIVVYLPVLADGSPTAAARLATGRQLTLRLTPWSEAGDRAGLQRFELDDPGLLTLPAYFAPLPGAAAEPDPGEDGSVPTAEEPATGEPAAGAGDDLVANFHRRLRELADGDQTVVRGEAPWLFLPQELSALAAESLSDEQAGGGDPLAAILAYRDRLAAAGVTLLFVPVPAKAAIYPEALAPELFGAGDAGSDPLPRLDLPRLDPLHRRLLDRLEAEGVATLDLLPPFLERRRTAPGRDDRLYCHGDTHWSGRGLELAAGAIAGAIEELAASDSAIGGALDAARRQRSEELLTADARVEIAGDLWRRLPEGSPNGSPNASRPPREQLPLTFVGTAASSAPAPTELTPVEPWRDSPVLLLGDSHNLVFTAGGDLHARGAGLPDHLALHLGFPVDLVAVRGSGANAARANLLRRGGGVEGKLIVVWCLSVREYVGQQWQEIPLAAGRPIQ